MWRSYYDRPPAALFLEMGELMRTEYGFTWLRSQTAARADAMILRDEGGDWGRIHALLDQSWWSFDGAVHDPVTR